MKGESGFGSVGTVNVFVAENRGFTAEEIADRAIDKIIFVGNESAPEVRDQALAYKAEIHRLLISYLKEAQVNERTTVYNKLIEAGLGDAAEFVQNL
jgi:hypothetical protein